MEAEVLEGFTKLDPKKAEAVLPAFIKNIRDLQECHRKQNLLFNQLIFHVTLKSHGLEAKDVSSYIYEQVKRVRVPKADSPQGYVMEDKDAVDWTTGMSKGWAGGIRETGRIAGVITKDPRQIIKFKIPCEHWRDPKA